MKTKLLFFCLLLTGLQLPAQFQLSKLGFRIGYNGHNAHASRFNHLINSFNNARYPLEISDNLPSLHFMHGWMAGVDYAFREDLGFYAVFKNKQRFIETQYQGQQLFREYFFREYTLEGGVRLPLAAKESEWFSHNVSGGLYVGMTSFYTGQNEEKGFAKAPNLVNIDHNAVLGLSIAYEAQLKFHENLRFFFRPVLQYALPAEVRMLNSFFNPTFQDDEVVYFASEDDKYNKGALSGFGIEGGLLILLPDL